MVLEAVQKLGETGSMLFIVYLVKGLLITLLQCSVGVVAIIVAYRLIAGITRAALGESDIERWGRALGAVRPGSMMPSERSNTISRIDALVVVATSNKTKNSNESDSEKD